MNKKKHRHKQSRMFKKKQNWCCANSAIGTSRSTRVVIDVCRRRHGNVSDSGSNKLKTDICKQTGDNSKMVVEIFLQENKRILMKHNTKQAK